MNGHTHDEEGNVAFQIAVWSDLWQSAAVNVVFQIALWSDLWQIAAVIRGLSHVLCCESGFGLDPDSVGSLDPYTDPDSDWMRIQEGKNGPEK